MNKGSIQFQFTATILATVAFALLLSSIGMLAYSVNVYHKHKTEILVAKSELISRAIIPALQFDDQESAQGFINLLKEENESEVIYAGVYSTTGSIITYWGKPLKNGNIGSIGQDDIGLTIDKGSMTYVEQVEANNEILGFVVIQVVYNMHKALKANIIIYTLVFFVALLASYLLSLSLQKKIVNPLVGVTKMLSRIRKTNDFSMRFQFQSTGEIGSLVNAINQLLQEVEQNRNELVVMNSSLHEEVRERREAEIALRQSQDQYLELNAQLEKRVKERTILLEVANQELESFSYSVSHDLRAPLRAMDGFSQALLEDYSDKLDEEGQDYLNRVRAAAQKMGTLIDDMLLLSRVSRAEMNIKETDLSLMAQEIIEDLREAEPKRSVQCIIQDNIKAYCDPHLIKIALTNLLNNAWKYSAPQDPAIIEFGMKGSKIDPFFYIKDNGVGFNMKYLNKLFIAFQRLHSPTEFAGTGIGLATVKRVISRHSGNVWAESNTGEGAVFYFTLPKNLPEPLE